MDTQSKTGATGRHGPVSDGSRQRLFACAVALAGFAVLTGFSTKTHAETRSLSFKQLHTGETLSVTYKRNGRYDQAAMKKINHIMRDWRRNEATTMDPKLVDLIWEVRRQAGSNAPIYILSGYRSPVTNAMLRSRSRGVAKTSQHTVGKALDFYIPGVPLPKLREIGLKFQRGGVGFYPTSGSPFVHLDTGSVRHWPRMTRSQLARLFPDGKTVHLPSDGKPMKGYEVAKAELARGGSRSSRTRLAFASTGSSTRAAVGAARDDAAIMTTASVSASASSRSASATGSRPASVERASTASTAGIDRAGTDRDVSSNGGTRTGLAGLFNRNRRDADSAPAEAPEPQQRPVAERTVVASLTPAARADAPLPRQRPTPQISTSDTPIAEAQADETGTEVAAPVPEPRPTLVAALEPVGETAANDETVSQADGPEADAGVPDIAAPLPEAKPIVIASLTPADDAPALPRERPLLAETSAPDAESGTIAGLLAETAPAEPAAEIVTALADPGAIADMPPFSATFTGQRIPIRSGPTLVAIDHRREALDPFMASGTCLRDPALVVLRQPDHADIGALATLTGPVVDSRFEDRPPFEFPMRRFTGPVVVPVATRTYQLASRQPEPVRANRVGRLDPTATTLR